MLLLACACPSLLSCVLLLVRLQEAARAKEQDKLARQARKMEKAEAARVAREHANRGRQATTGIKKHKRGPSTAGAPLVRLAWESPGAMPSPEPVVNVTPIPVAIAPMPAYAPERI